MEISCQLEVELNYEPQRRRPGEWRLVEGLEVDVNYELQPSKPSECRLVAGLEIDVSYEPQPRISRPEE
jgi:hypothetical protein